MPIVLPNGMLLYSREEWGADTSKWTWNSRKTRIPVKMKLPVRLAYMHHTVTAVSKDPFRDMRVVEDIGMDRFGRFSYSYAWHPSGCWLQGCGDWVGAHTLNQNSSSLGLTLIGNYEASRPPARLVDDMRAMVAWLEETKRLVDSTYPTTDHQGTGASTACAGRFARALMPQMRVPWKPKPTPPKPDPEPPKPEPEPPEDDDMQAQPFRFYKLKGDDKVWLVPLDHSSRQHVPSQAALKGHREMLAAEAFLSGQKHWTEAVLEVEPDSAIGQMLQSIPVGP